MSNPCKNCGANLPEGASFCPHCAQSQIERIEAKPPRLWRKKALMALAGAAAATAVVLAIVLPHRPKTYDGGGASVSYQDKDGAYELLLATAPGQIERKQPEEQRDLTLSPEDSSYITALLGVYQDGKLADAQTFLDKVERCTVEADPNEDGALELGPAEYNEMFDPAVLEADVFLTGNSGTNQLLWTLEMKNGDTIRLRQTVAVTPLIHQAYSPADTAMDTLDDLAALLERIRTEVPDETVVDIYLPAATYEGDLVLDDRAVNLYGCGDGSGRTVFRGSLTVNTREPDRVRLEDLDFAGSGGTGLTATAAMKIAGCTFTGYDIGALVANGGMIGVNACDFRENGVGFCYDTNSYTSFQEDFPDSILENNGIGVQFRALPGDIPLDFHGCSFAGNQVDVDNPIGYPIDLENATFD